MRNAHRPATATRDSARYVPPSRRSTRPADVRRHDVTAQLLELTD